MNRPATASQQRLRLVRSLVVGRDEGGATTTVHSQILPAAIRQHRVGAGRKRSKQGFKKAGRPGVIRIQKGDEFALAVRKPGVASGADSLVRLRDDPNSAVSLCLQVAKRAIARSVVYSDEFPVLKRLRNDAADAGWQMALGVEAGHDN